MMRARGAALIETVISLGVALTVMFGTFEIGLIGMTQLSSDGAAFVAAHASVMGNSPTAAVASPFPLVASSSEPSIITISTSAPDAIAEPVDYQVANQSNRHGGVQIVRPTHMQASVTQATVGIGLVLPLISGGSGFIEGNETVSDDGFDLAGTNLNSLSGEANEVNYFNDDGNAPPYFIGFRYMFHCLNWAYQTSANAACSGNQMDAAGFAEYLDGSNWNMPVDGTNSSSAVFYAMLLHQQVYAKLAQQLLVLAQSPANFTSVAMSDGSRGSVISAELDPSQQSANATVSSSNTVVPPPLVVGGPLPAPLPCLQNVYGWDIAVPPGYQIGTTQIGAYPLQPTYAQSGC